MTPAQAKARSNRTNTLSRRLTGGLEAVDTFISKWVGYAHQPADVELRSAGWSPDAENAYCHRCGDSVGAGESSDSGCATCRSHPAIADRVVRLGAYEEPLRSWVLQIKFAHRIDVGGLLGQMLGDQVRNASNNTTGDEHISAPIVVVPTPMPTWRRIYRGVDHARVIAEAAARRLEAPLIHLLHKRNGPPQVALSSGERRSGGGRAMLLRRGAQRCPLAECHVVLIDDVLTTGATLAAARRLIKPLGPSHITAAVLAVSTSRRAIAHGDGAHEHKHADSSSTAGA